MSVRFYQYPKCSTCRKAAKWLKRYGVEIESIDISQQPPGAEELRKMLGYMDGNIRKLFNTSGRQYRELKLKDKLVDMSDDDAMRLLASDGMLVKRPFLLTENGGTVGFREDIWHKLLLHGSS
ncbi:MAG: arsenate reductase family protein [Gammaproteobacteria bacterium]|nr:MAG: arsenate reductase family protein [Gammaproteobacteria bacterium]